MTGYASLKCGRGDGRGGMCLHRMTEHSENGCLRCSCSEYLGPKPVLQEGPPTTETTIREADSAPATRARVEVSQAGLRVFDVDGEEVLLGAEAAPAGKGDPCTDANCPSCGSTKPSIPSWAAPTCPSCGSFDRAAVGAQCKGDGGTHEWHLGAVSAIEPPPNPACDCDRKAGKRHRRSCALARWRAAQYPLPHNAESEEPPFLVSDAKIDQMEEEREGVNFGPARVWKNPTKTVAKWADPAMFTAEPVDAEAGPKVYLLSMTPDPLGTIAAATLMYEGRVIRSLSEVTDEDRERCFEQISKTRLKAPFEFLQFHFLIEGVTRGFTHQMVRQRTATYAQESMRFAVKEDMPVGLPPSLAGSRDPEYIQQDVDLGGYDRMDDVDKARWQWEHALGQVHIAYENLIDSGLPAEDARGLLPTNVLTRLHYRTDLNGLLQHGGNRLCTQAQFEWRLVFAKIVEAIRNYNPYANAVASVRALGVTDRTFTGMGEEFSDQLKALGRDDAWQYEKIADMFRPICYLTGKCEFKASFDRPCSIRDRVDAFEKYSVPSSQWDEGYNLNHEVDVRHRSVQPIAPVEWLANPEAAR